MIDQKFRSRSMFDPSRWELLERCAATVPYLPGVLLEIGSHKCGVTAWLAHRFPDRSCIAFDRFEEGLSELGPHDMPVSASYHEGVQGSDFADSEIYLSEYKNASLRRGDVRKTLAEEPDYKVAFALVDLNLYEPTVAALTWLAGRMTSGSLILVDDCNFEGVKAALDLLTKWEKHGHMGVVRS